MNVLPVLPGAAPLAESYAVWLCDVWGVVHNGVRKFPDAVDALRRHRAQGGRVVLLTNAPRPATSVAGQLEQLGVGDDAYDIVITSGDVTRDLIETSGYERLYHLGPARDDAFFEGIDAERTPAEHAQCIVCTGLLNDETETPDYYRERFADLIRRNLAMYCANPDQVVRRGENLFYCAGALATLYRELGGDVVICGKPHSPIYRHVFERLRGLTGAAVEPAAVLVIGDGIDTDLRGARDAGLDALFVADGIHAEELSDGAAAGSRRWAENLSHELNARLPELACVGIMNRLAW